MNKVTKILLSTIVLAFIFSTIWILSSQKKEILKERTNIKIANLPIVQGLPIYLAIEKGYFSDAGINVELVKFQSPNQIIDALLTNQVDLVSPSGAMGIIGIANTNNPGKSTLLNILSGVLEKDYGNIQNDNISPFEFSYIFQNYRDSLLPWRNNFENLSFPLQIQNIERKEIEKRVLEMKKLFKFDFDLSSFPSELSGGQQQILAFVRSIITKPKILFIDEAFYALDYENNLKLREHLQKYYLNYKPTIVIITHNIEEAVHLGEKIVILSKKPTKVIEVVDNQLPYPRKTDILKSKKFHDTKNSILSIFQKEIKLWKNINI